MNTGNNSSSDLFFFLTSQILRRFGHSIALLGDINGDNKNDVAIGAPFPSETTHNPSGAVFIYNGAENGLSRKPSQILLPKLDENIRKSFGFSLASGQDIDGNGFPDLFVGDLLSESVFLFWTAPPATILNPVLKINNGLPVDLEKLDSGICNVIGGSGVDTSVSATLSICFDVKIGDVRNDYDYTLKVDADVTFDRRSVGISGIRAFAPGGKANEYWELTKKQLKKGDRVCSTFGSTFHQSLSYL